MSNSTARRKQSRETGPSEAVLPRGIKLVRTLRGPAGYINCIAWSPDGTILASPSQDKTIWLWDTTEGKCVRKLSGHDGIVYRVAFDRLGRVLASGSADNSVRLWNTKTGKCLRIMEGHEGRVLSLAFDPKNLIIASGSDDCTVRLWEAASGRLLRTLDGHTAAVRSIAFGPPGVISSGSADATIRLWDVATGRLLQTFGDLGDGINTIAYDPVDELKLLSGGSAWTIKLRTTATGRLLRALKGHTGIVDCLDYSPKARLIASKATDGTVRLWNADSGKPIGTISEPKTQSQWLPGLAFHPELPLLATVGSDDNAPPTARDRVIHVWELSYKALLGPSPSQAAHPKPVAREVAPERRKTVEQSTIKALFALSGNRCSYPGCAIPLVDIASQQCLGEVCHIRAASPGGPRFDPTQSDSDRNAIDNLIVMCPTHHSLIDKDPQTHTAEKLHQYKAARVAAVAAGNEPTPRLSDTGVTTIARQLNARSVDFAIIVALPKELEAIRQHFPELRQALPEKESGRRYYGAELRVQNDTRYRVVVTLLNSMGNLGSTQATTEVIRDWSPRFVIVTGIAAGVNRAKQSLGDLVVSDSIVYYESGKLRDSTFEPRHKHFPADRTLIGAALPIDDHRWRHRLIRRPDNAPSSDKIPSIHFGPIASGEKVLASGAAVAQLTKIQPDLKAIEMESAGVASAALSALSKIGFIAIRSICDFADASKNDDWQGYAADVAASYTRALIDSRPVAPSGGQWPVETATIPTDSIAHREVLFDQICRAVDLEEFKNFCFLLGVDFDELPGDRKSAKVRELILWFERRKTVSMLIAAAEELHRPG